jgi:fatty acid desaturase
MKQLYELVTHPLSIIEDPFWDFVLMTIIGSLSFIIAWNFVGETGIRGKAGSILHWAVRIIVMFSLYFIISFAIKLVIIICHMPLVTWVTIGIGILLILLIVVTLKLTIFSKREKKNRQIDKQKNRYIILMKRIINYYYSNKNKFLITMNTSWLD